MDSSGYPSVPAGFGFGTAPPPLSTPTQGPIIGQQYCLPYETILILKEGFSISGQNMDISDVNGVRHFKLKAKHFSLHDRKVLYNAGGAPVASTSKKLMSLHNTTYICMGGEPSEANAVATVKTVFFSLKPVVKVFLKANTSPVPDFTINGNFMESDFTIVNSSGGVLAQASRDAFSFRQFISSRDTYMLKIAPGVDSAFMVALTFVVDDVVVDESKAAAESS